MRLTDSHYAMNKLRVSNGVNIHHTRNIVSAFILEKKLAKAFKKRLRQSKVTEEEIELFIDRLYTFKAPKIIKIYEDYENLTVLETLKLHFKQHVFESIYKKYLMV